MQIPDLQQPVTHTTKAAPLPRVLKDLSNKTHVYLDCDTLLDNEPIILLFDKVPLQTAMDKIASVFGGEWTKTNKGFKLQFGKRAADMHEAIIRAKQERIKKALDAFLTDPKLSAPYTEQRAQQVVRLVGDRYSGKTKEDPSAPVNVLQKDTPTWHLLGKLLKRIDLQDIASIGPHDCLAYSNVPDTAERQVTGIDDELNAFIEAQSCMVAAINNYPSENSSVKRVLTDNLGRFPTTAGAPRIVLVFQQSNDMVNARLWALDANGGQLGTAWAPLGSNEPAESKPAEKSDGIMATIGDPNTRVASFIKQFRHKPPAVIDSDIKSMFLSPTQYDPLSFRTSDIIVDLAKKHQANAVVVPPENSEQLTFEAAPEGACDLQTLEKKYAEGSVRGMSEPQSNLTLADGWILGGPIDPAEDVRTRYPRDIAEAYLNAVIERGYPTIDDGANLEQVLTPEITRDALGINRVCLRIEPYPWTDYEEQEALAFYGSLSSTQRDIASKDTLRLTPDQLASDQTRILQDAIVDVESHLDPDYPPDWPQDAPPLPAIPIELVGDGLPLRTTIEITLRSNVMGGFHLKTAPNERAQYENLNSMAYILANKTDPNSWTQWYDLDHLVLARKSILNIRIKMGIFIWEQAVEEEPHGGKATYDINGFLDQLSNEDRAEFTKEYQKQLAERGRANPDQSAAPLPPGQPPR